MNFRYILEENSWRLQPQLVLLSAYAHVARSLSEGYLWQLIYKLQTGDLAGRDAGDTKHAPSFATNRPALKT